MSQRQREGESEQRQTDGGRENHLPEYVLSVSVAYAQEEEEKNSDDEEGADGEADSLQKKPAVINADVRALRALVFCCFQSVVTLVMLLPVLAALLAAICLPNSLVQSRCVHFP